MKTNYLGRLPLQIDWKNILFLVLIFFLIVIFLRVFIFSLTPFFLALVIAIVIDRPVNLLARKIPRFVAVLITLIILLLVLLLIVIFVFANLISELIELANFLPRYRTQIMDLIDYVWETYSAIIEPLEGEVIDNITANLIERGERLLSATISKVIDGTVDFTINIPGLIIFVLFMVLTAFFLSKDKERIISYIKTKTQISDNLQANIIADVLSYVRVQLIIMTNTTLLTGITFYVLDYPYAILLALSSGILDLIPVVGPGGILWPLIIYNIFFDFKTSIIFFVLYLILLSARPAIESKILGTNIGVHPVILLFGLYVGLILLGVQGVILAPLSMIIFKALLNNGLA